MKRRPLGRDFGLSARMALVGVLLSALYLGIGVAAVRIVVADPLDWWRWIFPVAVLAALVLHVRSAERLVLRAADARIVDQAAEPELHESIERLSALADLPKPRIAVTDSPVPNALAAATTSRAAVVVVTKGLRDRLTPAELEGVIAHELAHIANRDAVVMTAASFFPTVGAYLGRWRFGARDFRDREWIVQWFVWPFWLALAVVLFVVGSVLTLTISRYREYAADRGAVLLTGAPEHLMSALQKLAAGVEGIPRRDLRALAGLNAFFIVSLGTARWELGMDHPPLEKRLARLAELARELGKAA